MVDPRRYVLLALCLLALGGCVRKIGESLESGREFSFLSDDGRWVGPVAPTSPDCGRQTTGLMNIGSGKFAFAPFQSIVSVEGTVEKGRLAGLATSSAPGEKPITMRFAGAIKHPNDGPATIEGTLTSGRCSWSVALHRG